MESRFGGAGWHGKLGGTLGLKGAHFLLGPRVNIYRAPMNGRNFEYSVKTLTSPQI
jgi:hypothetical protein